MSLEPIGSYFRRQDDQSPYQKALWAHQLSLLMREKYNVSTKIVLKAGRLYCLTTTAAEATVLKLKTRQIEQFFTRISGQAVSKVIIRVQEG